MKPILCANQVHREAPVLAIALKEKRGVFRGDREECEYVAKICAGKGIAVWVLHVEP